MTSKEKYLLKIAGRESEAVKLAKERIKNRQWLKESQLLAVRILMRLDELGLNQKDLAERLGVTAQYVSKLLKGKEKFGWEIVIAIQSVLDLPILYGYQPQIETSSKSYTEVVEVEANISIATEDEVDIKYGKIIPLFGSRQTFENYESALEM